MEWNSGVYGPSGDGGVTKVPLEFPAVKQEGTVVVIVGVLPVWMPRVI